MGKHKSKVDRYQCILYCVHVSSINSFFVSSRQGIIFWFVADLIQWGRKCQERNPILMRCLLFSPPLAHLWCNEVIIMSPHVFQCFVSCPGRVHCSNRHHMMMDQMHPWFSYCLSSVKLMPLLSNNHPISKHHKKYFQENNLHHQPFLCEIRIIRHNICSNSIKSLVSCVAIKTDHLNWERREKGRSIFWKWYIKQIPFVLCLLKSALRIIEL